MRSANGSAAQSILSVTLVLSMMFVGGYWLSLNAAREPTLTQSFQATTAISNAGMEKPALFTEHVTLGHAWPPRLDEAFPNLTMIAHNGDTVQIADFRGKVVLVEPIGMTCAACNAFSGANDVGGYSRITPQQNLPSIEKLLPRYADGTKLSTNDIVLVQVLLYDMKLKAPGAEDAQRWAAHFGFDQRENIYVLSADERYVNRASYDMIPGFFLVDRDGILRFDATGHRPKHNLFTELIPAISRFLVQDASASDAREQAQLLLSVDEAYRAIPHGRATFNPDEARIAPRERDYLHRVFTITDAAVVERVQSQMWFQTGGRQGGWHRNHALLLARLDGLDVPPGLAQAHQLIREAIAEQQRYFERWEQAGNGEVFNVRDPLVQSSHRKLIGAYNLLKARFPSEAEHNQKSFFDHLCALDFI